MTYIVDYKVDALQAKVAVTWPPRSQQSFSVWGNRGRRQVVVLFSNMDVTQLVFSVLVPLVISVGATYAVIRFSPERKDLKRVRDLLEQNATDKEQQRLAVTSRLQMHIAGAKVMFISETKFRLKQVQLGSELGAPFTSIEPETGTSTRHEINVSQDDIGKLYVSRGGGIQTGLLMYTALVDGRVIERRAVTLSEGTCDNPAGGGIACYYKMQ